MQQNKPEQHEEKEIICRKCNAVYIFLWMACVIVLFMMFICLYSLDLWAMWNSSVLEFFLLVELIIAIVAFEEYVNILVIWKDWIRFESWIIVKNKKEIPYDKINSINIHSIFWLGNLEVMTWNDIVTRYKFLDNYEEVGKIIKERIHKDKK
jgi:membrane protein YdbS with pleckstrin-like domain